jgi:hypothetical protein
VRSLESDVQADVVTSPVWNAPGRVPQPVGFAAIRVSVYIEANTPAEALRASVAHAVPWSPVANTLDGPVHLDAALGGTAPVGADA